MSNLNLNKVVLAGHLAADIELKQTTSGVAVVGFSIAVNRRRVADRDQEVDFINCVAWRQTAEFISKYFRRGSAICVTGSIQTRSWTDKKGNKKYATEVVIEAVITDVYRGEYARDGYCLISFQLNYPNIGTIPVQVYLELYRKFLEISNERDHLREELDRLMVSV